MKDRIFPTQRQEEGIASVKEYAGIDWSKFVEEFKPDTMIKEASKLPDELEEILDTKIADDRLRQAKTNKDDEEPCETDEKESCETDEEEESCGDDNMIKKGKGCTSQSRHHKIHFSSADQISAEAIEKAKESGDELLTNTILAARKQRRIHLANKIMAAEENMQRVASIVAENDIQDKIQKRHEYRQKLASRIEHNTRKSSVTPKIKVSLSSEFKNPTSFRSAEKRAFVEAAIDQGFPKEYVLQMLGDKSVSASTEQEEGIKKVMASDIPVNMKKAALQGMIKTAELDEAQKQRIKDYWIKDLHYGDEEWVNNWIDKNYK